MTPRRRQLALVALSFVAFVSLGLPDGVLGVAWPSVRATFDLPLSRLGLLMICGTCGYLLVSSLSGPIARRIGLGNLLVLSTAVTAFGLLLIALAAHAWWLPLGALFGGLGAGGIDAGLNAFAAERFSPRVVSWLHAFYGVGAMLGPLLVTGVLAMGQSWRVGYATVALTLVLLSVLFACTRRQWQSSTSTTHEDLAIPPARATLWQTLQIPLAWLHAMIFFMYCALEATAGQLAYTLLTESRGISPSIAGPAIAGYWGALTLGRLVFGHLATRWSHEAILRLGVFVAPVGVLMLWSPAWGDWAATSPTHAAWTSIAGLCILGGALAPIFPMLISATPERLGRAHAPNAVGFQVAAAALGVAIAPGLGALLMRNFGLETLGPFAFGLSVLLLLLDVVATRVARSTPSQMSKGA